MTKQQQREMSETLNEMCVLIDFITKKYEPDTIEDLVEFFHSARSNPIIQKMIFSDLSQNEPDNTDH